MRLVVAMMVTCALPAVAYADEEVTTVTLASAQLTFPVAPSWKVAAGDVLRDESDERTIDIVFERKVRTCRKFKPAADWRKEFPPYWPKRAKTHLYTQKTGSKLSASGCLANAVPRGSVIATIAMTAREAAWQPSADDVALVHAALVAAQAAAMNKPPPVPPKPPQAEPAKPVAEVTAAKPAAGEERKPVPAETKQSPAVEHTPKPPAVEPKPKEPVEPRPDAHRGGTTVQLPSLDVAVKLPKGTSWVVGARSEPRIERDDPTLPRLAVSTFATPFRTCAEWRTDASSSTVTQFAAQTDYLPASAKHGAFVFATELQSTISACVETKRGPLQLAIHYAQPSPPHTLEGADAQLTRALVEAIIKGANQQRHTFYTGTPLLDGGALANASIGKVTLPAGAQWRITSEAIERFDRGRYFALSLRSRPSCDAKGTEQPFLPASIKASVETRAWGTTVAKACLQTTRPIEATLVYDGAIAEADHAIIRALFEAVLASKKR